MEKLLFVDACIRGEKSRTKQLCDVYLEEFLKKNPDTSVETVKLRSGMLNTHTVEKLDLRDSLIRKRDFLEIKSLMKRHLIWYYQVLLLLCRF